MLSCRHSAFYNADLVPKHLGVVPENRHAVQRRGRLYEPFGVSRRLCRFFRISDQSLKFIQSGDVRQDEGVHNLTQWDDCLTITDTGFKPIGLGLKLTDVSFKVV